jgi:hypothetical protein
LTAHDGDVMCNNIVATFGNGDRGQIFRGMLAEGRTVTIDLPPGDRRSIDRVDFNCQPTAGGRASVEIASDIGTYDGYRSRNELRRYPDTYGRYPDTYERRSELYDRRDDPYYSYGGYWDRE